MHGIRSGKLKHLKDFDLMKRNSAVVFLSALVAILSCYPVLILDTVFYNLGFESLASEPCEIALDMTFTLYMFAVVTTLLFYWIRQKALYQQSVMSDLANKAWVRILSWFTLAQLLGGFLVVVVGFVLPYQSFTLGGGCKTVPPQQLALWPIYLGMGGYVLGQVLMMILFIYPLKEKSQPRNRQQVRSMFKRTAILVLTTIVSANLSPLIALLFDLGPTIHGPEALFEAHLMFSAFCVVLSFKAMWRKILLPCNERKTKTRNVTNTASTELQV